MGWGRIDDGFDDHPKVVALLDEDDQAAAGVAVGVWTLAFTWAHRNTRKRGKTPGLIPAGLPRRFLGSAGRAATELLVKHGLWEPHESGGWLIHDFGDYLPTDQTSEARSAAGKRGAAKRWGNQKGGADAPETSDANTRCDQDARNQPIIDGNLPSGCHDSDGKPIANDGSRAPAHRAISKEIAPTPAPEPLFAAASPAAPPGGQPLDPEKAPRPPKQPKAPPDEGSISAKDVVAAFFDASRAAGLPDPTTGIVGKVSRDAKRLLTVDKVPSWKVLKAAQILGENGWQSLDVQVRRIDAEQVDRTRQGRRNGGLGPGSHQPYRNPEDQSEYDEWMVRQ